MQAAMVHGGGGVLLMMTTKQTINNHKITNECNQSPLHHNPTQNNNQIQKHKNNHGNKHPAPSNKLTAEIQNFQMRKMDQR